MKISMSIIKFYSNSKHARSSTYCLWMLLSYNSIESLAKRLYGLQGLKYLPSGPSHRSNLLIPALVIRISYFLPRFSILLHFSRTFKSFTFWWQRTYFNCLRIHSTVLAVAFPVRWDDIMEVRIMRIEWVCR